MSCMSPPRPATALNKRTCSFRRTVTLRLPNSIRFAGSASESVGAMPPTISAKTYTLGRAGCSSMLAGCRRPSSAAYSAGATTE